MKKSVQEEQAAYDRIIGRVLDVSTYGSNFNDLTQVIADALDVAVSRRDRRIMSYDWMQDAFRQLSVSLPDDEPFSDSDARSKAERLSQIASRLLAWHNGGLETKETRRLCDLIEGNLADTTPGTLAARCQRLFFSLRSGRGGGWFFTGEFAQLLAESCPKIVNPLFEKMDATLCEESDLLNVDNDDTGNVLYPDIHKRMEAILDEAVTVDRQVGLCRYFAKAVGRVTHDRRFGLIHYHWFFRGLWGLQEDFVTLAGGAAEEARLLKAFSVLAKAISGWSAALGLSAGDGYCRHSASAELMDLCQRVPANWQDVGSHVESILAWLRFETCPTYYRLRAYAFMEEHDDKPVVDRYLELVEDERRKRAGENARPSGEIVWQRVIEEMRHMKSDLRNIREIDNETLYFASRGERGNLRDEAKCAGDIRQDMAEDGYRLIRDDKSGKLSCPKAAAAIIKEYEGRAGAYSAREIEALRKAIERECKSHGLEIRTGRR